MTATRLDLMRSPVGLSIDQTGMSCTKSLPSINVYVVVSRVDIPSNGTPLSQVDQALLCLYCFANKHMLGQQRNICRHMWYVMCWEPAGVIRVRSERILFLQWWLTGWFCKVYTAGYRDRSAISASQYTWVSAIKSVRRLGKNNLIIQC